MTAPAKIALLSTAFALVLVTLVQGHHIMGIPHYAYDENYPQAPVLKLVETVGRLELQLTGYPGKPIPGERTELHVYALDAKTRVIHEEPITLEVIQRPVFGKVRVIYGPKTARLNENVFKFYPTYPVDGNYELTLSFHHDGIDSTLSFPMAAGDPGSPGLTLAIFLAGFVLFVLVIRSIRIKRARREAQARALVGQAT